ncbi:hypothetical protein ACFFK0_13395 [Paenibacillus chartarius]|uniref:Uncharacterized protein n=1 Tax=Paenibacillus chartarius TaxID=747481 RepID=A0ABV6DLF9_9BACL
MKLNRHTGFALILILFGGLLLIKMLGSMFGYHHGHLIHGLMSWVIPVSMVGIGYYGITRGSKIAWVITIIGAIILLSKMSGLFILLAAVGLIAFGVSLLKRSSSRV